MSNQEPALEELWEGLNGLRKALNVPPLKELKKVWDVQIDADFRIFVNGSDKAAEYISPMGGTPSTLPPYNCHVFFGEWLAGTFGPFTGTFVYHPNCNGRKFLDAIEKKIKEVPAQ